MLELLGKQTEEFEEILVNIPHSLKRTGETYHVPEWLVDIPKIRIHRCDDYGPATKLLGALQCHTDPSTFIITVDDDVCYPPVMVETYMQCWAKYGMHVYCTVGFNIQDAAAFSKEVRGSLSAVRGHLKNVEVAEGFGSVLFQRRFFEDDIFEVWNCPAFFAYSDDLYISNYLSRKNIRKMTVETESFGGKRFWEPRLLQYGLQADALHLDKDLGTNRERYARTVGYLLENGLYYFGSEHAGGLSQPVPMQPSTATGTLESGSLQPVENS